MLERVSSTDGLGLKCGAFSNELYVLELHECFHSYEGNLTRAVGYPDSDVLIVFNAHLVPVKKCLKVQLSIVRTYFFAPRTRAVH